MVEIKTMFGEVISRGESLRKAIAGRTNFAGANLQGEDLSDMNLAGLNLAEAYLSCANFSGANFRGVNLSGADCDGANLRGSDFSDANLAGAFFYSADCTDASFRGAILARCGFRGAKLAGADFRYAVLANACLMGADTEGAKGLSVSSILPEGDLIVFKRCREGIVKLRIPADAKRTNATGRKCRAEFAEVLEIPDGYNWVTSGHDETFIYRVGETVRPKMWCSDRWQECSGGIHFFLTREEAENVGT